MTDFQLFLGALPGTCVQLQKNKIGPENLLMGILLEKDCLAYNLFDKAEYDIRAFLYEIKKMFSGHVTENIIVNNIPFSDTGLKVITLAQLLANHDNKEVDSIYVLKALTLISSPIQLLLQKAGIQYKSILILEQIIATLNTKLLNEYATHLTMLAREKKLDKVYDRDKEIKLMIEILSKRKKKNPILIGEPGVGKTAIVEGLAIKIANGDVPENLKNKEIYSLDLTKLVAGTSLRGEFEERITNLIHELVENPNIILFIDEVHMLIGSGNKKGEQDAANMLKPILTSNISCIGVTTLDEYQKHIEVDKALDRRFTKIIIEEPTVEQMYNWIQKIKKTYEDYHGVEYTNESLKAIVDLSARYLTDKHFPDKAIDLLDISGAQKKVKRGNLITENDIKQIVSELKGITILNIDEDIDKYVQLSSELSKVVVGQDEAINAVSQVLKKAKLGFTNPQKPFGVFLFVGASGTGKTLLARKLSEFLFGSEKNLIKLDMSEYSDKMDTSKIIGAAPGYVGYEEGGYLTEKVKTHPYSVILLDEIEKAHPSVLNLFLQVFDEGILTDNRRRTVNFKNTIIIMTSNIGVETSNSIGFNKDNSEQTKLTKAVFSAFTPEFLNRIDKVIVFNNLTKQDLYKIIDLELAEINKYSKKKLELTDEVKEWILEQVKHQDKFNAREIKRILQEKVIDIILDNLIISDKTEIKVKIKSGNIYITK